MTKRISQSSTSSPKLSGYDVYFWLLWLVTFTYT